LKEATWVDAPGRAIKFLEFEEATILVVAPSVTVTKADLSSEESVSFPSNLPSTETLNLNASATAVQVPPSAVQRALVVLTVAPELQVPFIALDAVRSPLGIILISNSLTRFYSSSNRIDRNFFLRSRISTNSICTRRCSICS
jgi:hypothetical protein